MFVLLISIYNIGLGFSSRKGVVNFIASSLLFICFSVSPHAQVIVKNPSDTASINEYQTRIKYSKIQGKYIPKDLNDALVELDKLVDDAAKNKFKTMAEDSARMKTHFSFGRWIQVRWSLQEGSRLTEWFRMNKIFDVDNMIDCIITTYHRKLNGKPIEFEKLADYYYKKQKEKVKEIKDLQAKTATKKIIKKSEKPK